jgi:hypothetical protein
MHGLTSERYQPEFKILCQNNNFEVKVFDVRVRGVLLLLLCNDE